MYMISKHILKPQIKQHQQQVMYKAAKKKKQLKLALSQLKPFQNKKGFSNFLKFEIEPIKLPYGGYSAKVTPKQKRPSP